MSDVQQNTKQSPYFGVGLAKFFILNMISFSLYSVYWWYQQWKRVQTRHVQWQNSALFYAVFNIFYCHRFFVTLKNEADTYNKQFAAGFHPHWYTFVYVISVLIFSFGSMIPSLSPYAASIAFVGGALSSAVLLPAQQIIHRICLADDPHFEPQQRFCWRHLLMMFFGLLVWVLLFLVSHFQLDQYALSQILAPGPMMTQMQPAS